MIKRHLMGELERKLKNSSVVAILGPRQVGKTTLAHLISKKHSSIYLDLESPEDLFKLNNPLLFLSQHTDKLVILDEIHRKPELFKVLRGLVDKGRRAGKKKAQFLILGSAGPDLLKQSSESLAGRISYIKMAGFNLMEIPKKDVNKLWVRGAFPDSYLAKSRSVSFDWRRDFISTYLERDIPQFNFRIPSERLRRLWTMLAHYQGQVLNASALAGNMEVSSKTIKYYIDIFSDLFLVRYLKPWHANVKKRLVKSPRIYIRDSGLLHSILNISNYNDLISHPVVGSSWEGFVIENILSVLPQGVEFYFYRTASGAEIDLILKVSHRNTIGVEIKKGLAPKISVGFHQACKDLKINKKYVIYSGEDEFKTHRNTTVLSVYRFLRYMNKL